jgi:hypothetical protein
MPRRIAVAAHVHRYDVIVRDEVRREMIEVVGDAPDAVQEHERLPAARAPIEIMDAKPVYVFEGIPQVPRPHRPQ